MRANIAAFSASCLDDMQSKLSRTRVTNGTDIAYVDPGGRTGRV